MTMSKNSFVEHVVPERCANCHDLSAGRPINYLGNQVESGTLSPAQASLLAAEGLLRCARTHGGCAAIDEIIEDALTVRSMSD